MEITATSIGLVTGLRLLLERNVHAIYKLGKVDHFNESATIFVAIDTRMSFSTLLYHMLPYQMLSVLGGFGWRWRREGKEGGEG